MNISTKTLKKIKIYLRAGIQLYFFILMPSAFTAAFAGVKSIFVQVGIKGQIGWSSFLSVLLVLCLYTIVFGRFFCGFACAFGSLGDALNAVYLWGMKKFKKKPVKINPVLSEKLSVLKYAVLAVICLLSFLGVYKNLQGSSPWDVFSMLHAGNFRLGGYIAGVVVLAAIMMGMCVKERFFCLYLCPMGAIFSLLPVLPFFSLYRNRENCIKGCKSCTVKCPSYIGLPDGTEQPVAGDCFMCQKCIGICSKINIHCGISEKTKGNEIIFTIIKTGTLIGLFIGLNI